MSSKKAKKLQIPIPIFHIKSIPKKKGRNSLKNTKINAI